MTYTAEQYFIIEANTEAGAREALAATEPDYILEHSGFAWDWSSAERQPTEKTFEGKIDKGSVKAADEALETFVRDPKVGDLQLWSKVKK